MESGRVSGTHFLIEKNTESGSGRPRVIWIYSRIERETHFTWENTRNLGGWYNAHFHWKTQGVGGGWSSVTYKFTVKMTPRRNLYGIHNDFSAVDGGLRRGCILIRNRDKYRKINIQTGEDWKTWRHTGRKKGRKWKQTKEGEARTPGRKEGETWKTGILVGRLEVASFWVHVCGNFDNVEVASV